VTQNFTTSAADDRRDEKQPSSEIRADIDQTRASVGDKIDQLQARLDPNRLKQQAQETVQEMLNDTASSMTEYVRSHKDEMVASVADAARRNPLPTALMGLGLGWLILESMAGNKREEHYDSRSSSRNDSRWESERRYLSTLDQRDRFESSTGRSEVTQGRGQSYSQSFSSGPQSGSVGYTSRPDYISGSRAESSGQQEHGNGQQEYGNGHQSQNPLAKAADAVKGTVGDVASELKERAGDVKERLSGAVGDVREQASNMGQQTQQGMYRAGNQMDEWQSRARYESQRRGQQVMRNLEDNPLTYGAIALAAGAALALFLPQTRTENRAFGEMRDQVMQKGQEVLETAKTHAQEVVAEVRPELEQKARQIVSDAAEMGKEVVKDAASELRPIVDKAVTKSKEEAMNAAQAVGVDPSKLTSGTSGNATSTAGGSTPGSTTGAAALADKGQGKTPVVNRDTMRGQWTQIKGEVKSKWGQLTDDELTRVEGDYEKLIGAIQTRYGYERGRAEQEVNTFLNSRKA